MEHRHKIIGTAGHIDHGKTELVKALTGTDTDRLKEEKERGLTIDLGFAFLSDDIAIIDVPGHEKFVKNMVAGVIGIDMALPVVAADDGIMPQTREHFDILKLLNIEKGIIVITKIDLVDEEWLELVESEINDLVQGSFLEKAPIFKVSSITGEGIDLLKQAIFEEVRTIKERDYDKPFRLPLDRSFTIKGFGTVITGTVLSGKIKSGSKVELLPQKRELRIRGIETHGKKVEEARAGDRAALNLPNIEKDEIERGEVLAEPGFFKPRYRIDCKFHLLKSAAKPLPNRTRVKIHIGTKEGMGRIHLYGVDEIQPGDSGYIQLRTEVPFITSREDRFIIRKFAPEVTIGGGEILDPYPFKKEKDTENIIKYLRILESRDLTAITKAIVKKSRWKAVAKNELAAKLGVSTDLTYKVLSELEKENVITTIKEEHSEYWIDTEELGLLKNSIVEEIQKFHQESPLKKGIKKVNITDLYSKKTNTPALKEVLNLLAVEGKITEKEGTLSLSDFKISIKSDSIHLKDSIEAFVLNNKFQGQTVKEVVEHIKKPEAEVKEMLNVLLDEKKIAFIDNSMYIHSKSLDQAKEIVKHLFKTKQDITVSEFRNALGVSRKFALPVLIYFDNIKVTGRDGGTRILL